ncbi:DUF2752 domain-containing protein [Vulgatibacter incomptus]|uniref:DUF2752 domain-containing protein n=1 Tax=Vulgatibacter incomptus TaxID=1391653 RepID=A0A0K1PIF6_9BACT|nr:DUF2752 domain-containing protein [Vulgatibacter incomptus]AKU93287.1 hypothetical protein AKJ08_3674 [Vulgatibacter incomptus]
MFSIEWGKRSPGFRGADGLAALGLVALAASLALPHVPLFHSLFPRCHFLDWTGLPCGTCGFTRAFVRGAHLDLAGALSVSPFGAMLFWGWAAASLWIAATWLLPGLPLPRFRASGPSGRWMVRFGIPLAFALNWAYLIGVALLDGSPPA